MNGKHFALVVGLGVVVGTIIGAAIDNVGLGVSFGISGGALIYFVMIYVGRGRDLETTGRELKK